MWRIPTAGTAQSIIVGHTMFAPEWSFIQHTEVDPIAEIEEVVNQSATQSGGSHC